MVADVGNLCFFGLLDIWKEGICKMEIWFGMEKKLWAGNQGSVITLLSVKSQTIQGGILLTECFHLWPDCMIANLSNVALILLNNANDVCFGGGRKLWQVFGMRKLYWFLPLYADDDLRQMTVLKGLDYPLRLDMDGQEF
jgi:hypothetical protein